MGKSNGTAAAGPEVEPSVREVADVVEPQRSLGLKLHWD